MDYRNLKSIQQIIAERKRQRKFTRQLLMFSTIVHLVVFVVLMPVKLSWEDIKVREKPMIVTITKPPADIELIKRSPPSELHISPRSKEVAKKDISQPPAEKDVTKRSQTRLIEPDEFNPIESTERPKSPSDISIIEPQFSLNDRNSKSPGPVADAMPIPELEYGQETNEKPPSASPTTALISLSEFSATDTSKLRRQVKSSENSMTADEHTMPVLLNRHNVKIRSPETGGPFREVIIELWVNEEGKPEDLIVWSPRPPYDEITKRYVDAAVEAVRKYLFRPALKNNVPVGERIRIPIQFNIMREAPATGI